jgi:prephenate dehydrogenase
MAAMSDIDGFRIAITGLGLMGGSLAMALKIQPTGCSIFGADIDPETIARAHAQGVVDGVCDDYASMDLIVLAMPVRGIIRWLNQHGCTLPAHCIVMDLGSTKQAVVAAMDTLPAQCIGGHPMCGKETSGLDSADAALFRGARFVLVPTARTTPRAMSVATAVVTAVGAEAVVMEAAAHDRAVAAISHAPYLLSAGLVNAVGDLNDDGAKILAASGYRGMTRLAASDVSLMSDIIDTNAAAVVEMLDRCQSEIGSLRDAIAAGDEKRWRARLTHAHELKRNE